MKLRSTLAILAVALLPTRAFAQADGTARSMIVGWFAEVEDALVTPELLQIHVDSGFFELSGAQKQALLTDIVEMSRSRDEDPNATQLIEIRSALRGHVLRWDSKLNKGVLISQWDQRKPPRLGTDLNTLRGNKPWFFHIGGSARLSSSVSTGNFNARIGAFLLKGRYDLSAGIQMGGTSTNIATPDGSGESTATSSNVNVTLLFRRHFVIPSMPKLSPNIGGQALFATVNEDNPINPGLVIGLAYKPGKGPGVIDLSFSRSIEATSANLGYTVFFF